jgi:ribosome-binding factor A
MTRRTERLNDVILREISQVIQKEIRDPRIGFVTVSRVDITRDLAFADVFVSVLGEDKEKNDSLNGLISCASYLRKHLASTMHTRTVPKLRFKLDEGPTHSEKINNILKGLDLDDVAPSSDNGES